MCSGSSWLYSQTRTLSQTLVGRNVFVFAYINLIMQISADRNIVSLLNVCWE